MRTALVSGVLALWLGIGPLWAADALPVPVTVSPHAGTGDGPPGPRCYRKEHVPAKYATSRRLVRKARLVHQETESGQIEMVHYPAIYVEEKTLVEPAYVLLQEVACTPRILRSADRLPPQACERTRGCQEIE